jgi:hypothetical protein
MEAHGQVYVQGKDFWARCDSLYYNQQKDQVILEGKESGYATLYKYDVVGGKPQVVEGRQIIYNRATGQTWVNGASSVTGSSAPRR